MSNTLSYRIGSLKKPHLPFAQVAEMGIKGLELVWEPDTTASSRPLMQIGRAHV